jgi:hypothetical protein
MTKPVSTATGGSLEPVQQIFFRIEPLKKRARVRAQARARAIKKQFRGCSKNRQLLVSL